LGLLVAISLTVWAFSERLKAEDRRKAAVAAEKIADVRRKEAVAAEVTAEDRRKAAVAAEKIAQTASAEAERQGGIATALRLAAQADAALAEGYPQRSLLLAVEAIEVTLRDKEPRVPAAEQALRQALAKVGGRGLGRYNAPMTAVAAFSRDGRWLA